MKILIVITFTDFDLSFKMFKNVNQVHLFREIIH